MASLLARIGAFSARRGWAVIVAWVVLLGVGVGSFLAFGGSLSSSFTIPGTETSRVTDEIADRLGESTSSATIVFHADDELTGDQEQQISDLLADIGDVDGVDEVVDPFETEADRADQVQELDDAQADIDDGWQQVEDGQAEIDDGQQQLDAALAELEAGQQQLDQLAQQVGEQAVAQQQAELDAGFAQIEQQQAELDEGQQQLDDSIADLEDGEAELADGRTLLEAAEGVQTVSDDGTTAVASILFESTSIQVPTEVQEAVLAVLDETSIDGVDVWPSNTLVQSVEGILGPGEIAGVVLALIVLIVMLRSVLPAITPILTSVVGVGVGVTGTLAFSGVVEMSSVTPVLGVMLGLAVGIDYTLFIINRHRTQVLHGMGVRESIALANGTSGTAVVFAGATVLIALLALGVTGIGFLGVMGTVAAVCVLVAVLVAVTLTPALLGLIGSRILSRRARKQEEARTPKPLGRLHSGWAVLRVVVAVAALAVLAIPTASMRLGLPDGSGEATDSTSYLAYHATEEAFGAGVNGPLVVAATLPDAVSDDDETHTQAEIADQLMQLDDVVAVAPAGVADERDFMVFQVIPADGPNSVSTEELVHELRDTELDGGVTLGVAGFASGNIDVSERLADALPLYLLIVVGLSILILLVVFRSLLVPLIATAGFALSFAAALGAMVAVFQWGWLGDLFGVHDPGPLLSFAPIIIVGVLFGLAMDYQLFLVSGMREAFVHGTKAKEAVVAGMRNGAPVVTAAAIIMISVFGGFVFSHMAMIRPLGFGLAIGVLFDAFVVRMVITPALMHLLGRSAWWLPRWLDRILPHVDVEGSSLERTAPVSSAPAKD